MKRIRKAGVPGSRAPHPISSCYQGDAKGDAPDCRSAADSVCCRRSSRSANWAILFSSLAQQAYHRRPFRSPSPELELTLRVWCACELVGAEPFALLLPNVLIQHAPGCLAQSSTLCKASTRPIIAVEELPWDCVHMYNAVGVGERTVAVFSIIEMIEKPEAKRDRQILLSLAGIFCSRRSWISGAATTRGC
jgi:hypothetical protein